jgi:hypothetical protein
VFKSGGFRLIVSGYTDNCTIIYSEWGRNDEPSGRPARKGRLGGSLSKAMKSTSLLGDSSRKEIGLPGSFDTQHARI